MGYRSKADVIKILRTTMPCLKIMEFPVKRIGLFGSVAREDDRMDSDIDIMLEFYHQDDTTVVCGCMDAKKVLADFFIDETIHITDYPLSSEDPPELIWIME